MKLNLGSADRHFEGFISVDMARPDNAPPDFQIADLNGPWPWADSSVEEVKAFDVAEHVRDCDHFATTCSTCMVGAAAQALTRSRPFRLRPHPLARIHFMNELHRVLVPGGRATIEVPDAMQGAGFFQDPTHSTPWTRNSFQYFEAGSFAQRRLAKAYGITAAFRIIPQTDEDMQREVQILRKPYKDTFDWVWKLNIILEAVK